MRTKPLPAYEARNGRRIVSNHPCIVCGKEVNPKTARYVHLINGGHIVLHPSDEHLYESDGGDVGGQPIGPDCAKRLGLEWSSPAIERKAT
jgi:hypothetical protein